ncbi:MAG TPA: hypothetical protein VHB72_03000 [Candidatus Saccharimonadales bacterium]|nr:hypothetical protein [Candidatus Saccharimonadales bacterium]
MGTGESELETAASQRFCRFVEDHSNRAVRWVFMGEGWRVPMEFAEFEIRDERGKSITPRSFQPAAYLLKINAWLTQTEQNEFGIPSAEISIERRRGQRLMIHDRCSKLPELTGDIPSGPEYPALAVNGLLDALEGMQGKKTFLPAAMRNNEGYPQLDIFLA